MKVTVYGTKNDDEFVFSYIGEENILFALAGNDTVYESADFQSVSIDEYHMGKGHDSVTSYSGTDTIWLAKGNDVVHLFGDDIRTVYGGCGYDIAYVHRPGGNNEPHSNADGADYDYPDHMFKNIEEIHFV